MKIYMEVPKFNPRTGKQDGTYWTWKETRCDFSGRVVASAENEGLKAYYYEWTIDHGDEDSCYGSDSPNGRKYGVYLYPFLAQPFVVYDDAGNRSDTGETEMPAFLKALGEYEDFDMALRDMRMKTLKKLLDSGEIKAKDVGEGE